MDEAAAVARADLGAVGDANEVCMAVHAEAHVELVAALDAEGLEEVAGLLCAS